MPIDSILVSAAVAAMFVTFAGALFWAERQTRPIAHEAAGPNGRRRAF